MFSRLSLAATRSLSSVTKTSTGLVGLKVHPDPIPALIGANEKLLEMVKGVPEVRTRLKTPEKARKHT